jgi:outer membrane protein
MTRRLRTLSLPIALCAALLAAPAVAEDLQQIYAEALRADPGIAAAKAQWEATQERRHRRCRALPTYFGRAISNYDATIKSDPAVDINRNFNQYNATIFASQPLFRYQNLILYDQAKQQVTQADFILNVAKQDLIVRVAVTYFDILLAQFNIELTESQKKAVSEQLAQAKRNFEVGVATITDTNEAQAKYDAIVAQEIRPGTNTTTG